MAYLCYDRRRELAIVKVISSLSSESQPTLEEKNFLIQPYNLRDPRLDEVKYWVHGLCVEKNAKEKFDQLRELIDAVVD